MGEGREKSKADRASSLTYLNRRFVNITRLHSVSICRWLWITLDLTSVLTMILDSPFPATGPLGIAVFTVDLAVLVGFCTPPTGAAVVLARVPPRRPPRPRREFPRRSVRISSRDLSSFIDMLSMRALSCLEWDKAVCVELRGWLTASLFGGHGVVGTRMEVKHRLRWQETKALATKS